MAASDKNIIITPNRSGPTAQPEIFFGGSGNNPIRLKVLDDTTGTLSFEGAAGQLFSINNSLTSGSIFSVNDVSGIPSINVDANGIISMAAFGGTVGIGTTTPTSKLSVAGTISATNIVNSVNGQTGNVTVSGGGGGVTTTAANTWTALQTFSAGVSTGGAGVYVGRQGGIEGGEITLQNPASSTSIVDNVVVDVYGNLFRIFESGGTNRGCRIDITSLGAAASSVLATTSSIGNGTLTLNTSGTGLGGSQTFTANQSGNATFTVTSNATSENTASTIVARDGSGNFSAGTVSATVVSASNGFQVGSGAINAQTTGYSLVAGDNGKIVTINSASAVTLTAGTAVGTTGFSCTIIQLGAGQVTVAASGTTINSIAGLKFRGQHSAASLICYATNTFNLAGGLTG